MNYRRLYFSLLLLMSIPLSLSGDTSRNVTLWTTGKNLMPQWGFYPLSSTYGETKPLGGPAAWTAGGSNTLTWVADFPSAGTYDVWVRRYTGYGHIAVSVNGKMPSGALGGSAGGRYNWRHKGKVDIAEGRHHVDMQVSNGMFDAVLFTTSASFHPDRDKLPEPVKEPVSRALRHYPDQSHLESLAAGRAFIIGKLPLYQEIFYDWLPLSEDDVIDGVKMWGGANQYINGTFGIRALESIDKMEISLDGLEGPSGRKIGREHIDLRVVFVRDRKLHLFWDTANGFAAELLLRDNRTTLPPSGRQGGFGGGECIAEIPAGESRQVWLTVHLAEGYPAGLYAGSLELKTDSGPSSLPVQIDVLPVDLRAVEGYYSIYHPLQPVNEERGNYVCEKRYRAELEDMVRHGLNTVTLYGGFQTLPLARDAGMTAAPCMMHWPAGDAPRQVEQAKEMGFDGLLYYGVDEPTTPEQIERCRKEAERRNSLGLSTMAAINSVRVWEQMKDVISHPVLVTYHFHGRNNSHVLAAREKGFLPVSYWMTNVSFPLWHRSLAGLYNTACGFLGTVPWSYTDFPDPEKKYDPAVLSHQVTYPDEFGYPIPTLQWAAYRAGIDDVRYLQALLRAVEEGESRLMQGEAPAGLEEAVRQAKDVYARRFEAIGDRWFVYLCRVSMETLEATRREFAEAAARITQLVR